MGQEGVREESAEPLAEVVHDDEWEAKREDRQRHIPRYHSRRSPVLGTRGMVASSQPLASEAGLRILQQGGTAADAAVAVAAALNVVEPCSTGIGGDAFCLYFDAATKKVSALMGNGRSPQALTLEEVRRHGVAGDELPVLSGLTVTVPGTAMAWEDTLKSFGRLPMAQVLKPAIELAEGGFPVHPVAAHLWGAEVASLQKQGRKLTAMLQPNGSAPKAGQIQRNPDLASTFRTIAEKGVKDGFYRGRIADAIAQAVQEHGGVMTTDDLEHHFTEACDPITTTYRGYYVYEVPPPTAGIAALMAFNLLDADHDLKQHAWGSAGHLHACIEAMRLSFADTLKYNADPAVEPVPVAELLDKQNAAQQWQQVFSPSQAATAEPGRLPKQETAGDTCYFTAVDGEGNGCSFIQSNYMGFGTGIIPEGCGFTLQNRGHNFCLDPSHPNCVAPRKRPYHTIIPAIATDPAGDLYATFGVMGDFMQPQGHLQVLTNMIDYGMEPQASLDMPRWRLDGIDLFVGHPSVAKSRLLMEEGFDDEVIQELRGMGHEIKAGLVGFVRTCKFGRGQIIQRNPRTGVLWGGSDPRIDGQVCAW